MAQDRGNRRRCDDEDRTGLLHEVRGSRDPRPVCSGLVAGRVLHRVADFVRRDHDGGQGPAMEILGRQPNRLGERMVMIAALGFLDLDRGELHAVEQVAGEFPAGPGDFRRGCRRDGASRSTPRGAAGRRAPAGEGRPGSRASSSHRDVVDQPSLAQAGGDKKAERAVGQRLDAGEAFGVARFEIVDRESRCLDLDAPSLTTLAIGSPAAMRAARMREHPVERRRDGALFGDRGRRCARTWRGRRFRARSARRRPRP